MSGKTHNATNPENRCLGVEERLALTITETTSCDKGASLAFRISLGLLPSHSRFKSQMIMLFVVHQLLPSLVKGA